MPEINNAQISKLGPWGQELAWGTAGEKLNRSCIVALSRSVGTVDEAKKVVAEIRTHEQPLTYAQIITVANSLGFKRKPKPAPAASATDDSAPAEPKPEKPVKDGWRSVGDIGNQFELVLNGEVYITVSPVGDGTKWELLCPAVQEGPIDYTGTAAAAKREARKLFIKK